MSNPSGSADCEIVEEICPTCLQQVVNRGNNKKSTSFVFCSICKVNFQRSVFTKIVQLPNGKEAHEICAMKEGN